jgi:hypothetical protein
MKKWFGFGIAIATIVIGALNLLLSFPLFDVSGLMAQYRGFAIVAAILSMINGGLLTVLGIFDLKAFLNKKDDLKFKFYELIVPSIMSIVILLVTLPYINSATVWALIIFDVAVVVLLLIALFSKYEKRTKGILTMIACGIELMGTLISIDSAIDVINLLYIAAFITYFVFEYFVEDNITDANTSTDENSTLE